MNDRRIEQAETKDPKVTVLMAVYNGEHYLREAIESILKQTFTDFEFVIVNDGSTDSSCDIALSYNDPRIRLVDNPENIGLTKSLNRGLSLARGEYVARQDADDVSHPTRFEKQVRYLDAHNDVVVLGTQARIIDRNGKIKEIKAEEKATKKLAIQWQIMFDSPCFHSAVMFRKKIVLDIFRGYDENFTTSQDFELWSRLVPKYSLLNLHEVLLDFRTHDKSISNNYSTNNITKVKPVFIRNITHMIGDEQLACQFAGLWLSITNPRRLNSPPQDAELIPDLLKQLYNKFIEIYPEAVNDDQIIKHLAQKYVYCAFYILKNSRIKSIAIFYRALKFYPGVVKKYILKYLLLFLLGHELFRFLKNAYR